MNNHSKLSLVAAALATLAGSAAHALPVFSLIGGVNSTKLISYDSANPALLTSQVALTGFPVNDLINEIDFRPSNGQLYGLGQSRLYTINPTTGVVTVVGSTSPQTFANFGGFDFDPVADVIHFVNSSNGTNVTINPDTAAVTVNTAVSYAPGDPRTTAPAIGGLAFSNNVAGAATSTEYAVDINGGYGLATLAGASGQLTSVGSFVSTTATASPFEMDISPAGLGFAIFGNAFSGGNTQLYSVNLLTGTRSLIGVVGGSSNFINARGLAIPTNAVPEPSTALLAVPALAMLLRRRAR